MKYWRSLTHLVNAYHCRNNFHNSIKWINVMAETASVLFCCPNLYSSKGSRTSLVGRWVVCGDRRSLAVATVCTEHNSWSLQRLWPSATTTTRYLGEGVSKGSVQQSIQQKRTSQRDVHFILNLLVLKQARPSHGWGSYVLSSSWLRRVDLVDECPQNC